MDWNHLTQDRDRRLVLVNTVINLWIPESQRISWLAEFNISLSRRTPLHGISLIGSLKWKYNMFPYISSFVCLFRRKLAVEWLATLIPNREVPGFPVFLSASRRKQAQYIIGLLDNDSFFLHRSECIIHWLSFYLTLNLELLTTCINK
jgi:hypothetical protein